MEIKDQVRTLRESTGMNRKEFCTYFGIPYRTMTEWELGHRKLPDYVLRMMTYQVKMEKLDQKGDISNGK
ncbi:MAG: transcriptional regulator [Lachnospiraceae bacterium]|nr:transcriptional regulator [Lachnospiraceae bacterium]